MSKQREFEATFRKDMGIDDEGRKDGVRVQYDIRELTAKKGYSTWQREGTGRYQIKIYTPWNGRHAGHQIFRTSKADGSYRVADALETVDYQVQHSKQKQSRADMSRANAQAAEALREKYKGPHTYFSSWKSDRYASSIVAPDEHITGNVDVLINFGSVTAEQADRILAFFQDIKQESSNV